MKYYYCVKGSLVLSSHHMGTTSTFLKSEIYKVCFGYRVKGANPGWTHASCSTPPKSNLILISVQLLLLLISRFNWASLQNSFYSNAMDTSPNIRSPYVSGRHKMHVEPTQIERFQTHLHLCPNHPPFSKPNVTSIWYTCLSEDESSFGQCETS